MTKMQLTPTPQYPGLEQDDIELTEHWATAIHDQVALDLRAPAETPKPRRSWLSRLVMSVTATISFALFTYVGLAWLGAVPVMQP